MVDTRKEHHKDLWEGMIQGPGKLQGIVLIAVQGEDTVLEGGAVQGKPRTVLAEDSVQAVILGSVHPEHEQLWQLRLL